MAVPGEGMVGQRGARVCVCVRACVRETDRQTDRALSCACQGGQLQGAEMGWSWACCGRISKRRDSHGAENQTLMPRKTIGLDPEDKGVPLPPRPTRPKPGLPSHCLLILCI